MPRQIPDPSSVREVHIIAICGTAMGAFAGLLREAGFSVRGSDINVYPPMSTQLEAQGIVLLPGFSPEHLDPRPDLVVVGNAVRRDNPESQATVELDLPYASFPETLSELFLRKRHSIVVAGTHGKTTTSSLAAYLLDALGADPGFLIGGVVENFGRNFRSGHEGGYFVVEGDEYDTAWFDKGPKFLHYRPRSAILTSVEFDHADIYRDLEHVKLAFRAFLGTIPEDGVLFACVDGVGVREVMLQSRAPIETYAVTHQDADWTARVLESGAFGMRFAVCQLGEEVGRFEVPMVGLHNLANCLAVIGLLLHHGFVAPDIARALPGFAGVKRRQTVFAEPRGITLIDDFAHHPTAVRETIAAIRMRYGNRRLITVFEPRTNTTRRKVFQTEYSKAFDKTDELLMAPVFSSNTIPEAERFDPEQLVAAVAARGVRARMGLDVDGIVSTLAQECQPGDVVLILSNGGFGGIYSKLPPAILAAGA